MTTDHLLSSRSPERIQQSYEWQTSIRNCVDLSSSPLDERGMLDRTLATLGKILAIEHAFLLLFHENEPLPKRYAYHANEEIFSPDGMIPLPSWRTCPYLQLSAGKKLIYRDDIQADHDLPADWQKALAALGVRGFIGCPVVHQNQLLSVLIVCQSPPRQWKPDELALVATAADQIALVLLADTRRRSQKDAQARFFPLFQNAAMGFAKVGLDCSWQSVNPKLCEITGYSKDELLSMTFKENTHPDDLALDLDNMQKVMAGELDINVMEKRYIRKNGSIVWVHLTATLVRDEDNRPDFFIVIIEDITSRKQAEQALAESEERYGLAVRATTNGIWDWDISTNNIVWSERLYSIYGLSEETDPVTYESIRMLIHPDDRDKASQDIYTALKTADNYESEYRVQHTSGEYLDMLHRGIITRDGNGAPIRVTGSAINITESKKVAEALKESEERFRTMADASTVMIVISDKEGHVTYLNKACLDFFGYPFEELTQMNWVSIIHPDDREQHLKRYAEGRTSGKKFNCEFRMRRADGEYRWIYADIAPMRNATGEIIGSIGSNIDLTERKQAEEALRITLARESLVRRIIEGISQSRDPNFILNTVVKQVGEFLQPDRCHISRFSIEHDQVHLDMSAQYCAPHIMPVDTEDITTIIQAIRHLSPQVMEENQEPLVSIPQREEYEAYLRARMKDINLPGLSADELIAMTRKYGVQSSLRVGIFHHGVAYGSMSLSQCNPRVWRTDEIELVKTITNNLGSVLYQAELFKKEQQAQQEVLQLNEELEFKIIERTAQLERVNKELESFSYSVSHDLRAPLRTIDGFSEAVLAKYGDNLDDQGKDYLNRVRSGSQHMARLIDDLLSLSRLTRGNLTIKKNINLSTIVSDIAKELQVQDPARNVEFEIQQDVRADGDKQLLQAVFQNLLDNAWKYTSKLALARVEFGNIQKDGACVYYIKDNGAGFDMQYANKLFGAFQRLHSAKEFPGNGIGLATVARIVHHHGGSIWAESQVEQGATFYFTLGYLTLDSTQ